MFTYQSSGPKAVGDLHALDYPVQYAEPKKAKAPQLHALGSANYFDTESATYTAPDNASYPAPQNVKYAAPQNIKYPAAVNVEYHGSKPDHTRSNTKTIMHITKAKTVTLKRRVKGLKSAFRNWRHQYKGLTWKEAMWQFLYNMSHSGITVATIIYCIVFILFLGSTILSNYAQQNTAFVGRYALIGLNCVIGIISLFFNFLPAILMFDYIIGCAGIGFFISSTWQINQNINRQNNWTLVWYAVVCMMIIPFRIFWWHRYGNKYSLHLNPSLCIPLSSLSLCFSMLHLIQTRYWPNQYIALDTYSGLAQQGLIKKVTFDDDDLDENHGKDAQTVIEAEQEQAQQNLVRDDSMFTYQ